MGIVLTTDPFLDDTAVILSNLKKLEDKLFEIRAKVATENIAADEKEKLHKEIINLKTSILNIL